MFIRFEKIWTYLSELILSSLVCVLLWITSGPSVIGAMIFEKRVELIALTGGAATLAGVVFAAYIALLQTDFGKRIRLQGASLEYAHAIAFPFLLLFLTTVVLSLWGNRTSISQSRAMTFVLVYCGVNFVTMIRNVLGLVKLWECLERAGATGKVNDK